MDRLKIEKPSLGNMSGLRRKAVSSSQAEWIKTGRLPGGAMMPLVVQPSVDGMNLPTWLGGNRQMLDRLLLEHRALLLRGFDIRTPDEFERLIKATSDGEMLEYKDRSSPRHEVLNRVYTSTDYPADQTIFPHNEGTYWQAWPLRLYFCCAHAPAEGGETPIADTRNIYRRLDPALRERFREKKVLYVRNYNDGFGLTWQNVFQTDDREVVNDYCRRNDIEVEWKAGDRLKTRTVRQAIATHPMTGEEVWFNHATFFHVTTLAPSVREALLSEFAEEDLPTNTYYGDGTPIEPSALDELRALYLQEKIVFPWQEGDVMLLDNMSVAHGREPFAGFRQVLAGMAEPFRPQ
jgi:alpha-ketoglutarate-dependent taurine dioxygenase